MPDQDFCRSAKLHWTVGVLSAAMVVASIVPTVSAAQPASSSSFPANDPTQAADDRRILGRFLLENTFAVARVDVGAFDWNAIREWGQEVLRSSGQSQQEVDEYLRRVRGTLTSGENQQAALQRAKVRRVYLMFNLPILADPPYAVVPLDNGADPDPVAAQIEALELMKSDAGEVGDAPIERAVVYGLKQTLERLRHPDRSAPTSRAVTSTAPATPSNPADVSASPFVLHRESALREAMMAVNDSPIAVAVDPKVVAGFADMARQDKTFESQIEVVKGWRWLAIGVKPPANPALNMVLATTSPKDAAATRALLLKEFDEARKDRDGFAASLKNVVRFFAAIAPRQEGERLVLSLDADQINGLLAGLIRYANKATTQPQTTRPQSQPVEHRHF